MTRCALGCTGVLDRGLAYGPGVPRQDYYRYMFGFHILPLGSWPLSSSYAVFYFCRKSLTGLEGAGMGVMTQVPGEGAVPGTGTGPGILHRGESGCLLASGRNHTLNPGEDRFPYSRPGSGTIEPLIFCRRWRSPGLLMASWRWRSLYVDVWG
ncbi:hypothetical protein F2Q68_00005846 [Brassica cretica]|uniref:Uncharacterized protein n=1 Tax=Brassica cretica TaxID=69181 RepID=A0A8S9JL32_BRACR|nr:hypothetical protein F2Q68_00005846 [Brassica cretica]